MPRFISASVLVLLWLGACSPKVDVTGYVFSDENLSEIMLGMSDRDAVYSILGSPSSRSSFGTESWYYVNNTKEAYAFMQYEVTEQDVLRITFDDFGIVQEMKRFDMSDSADIEIVQRETPSEGHSLGFVEQILGNIGRFNAPGSQNQPTNDRRGPNR